jgi:hypothetical protein
MSRYHTPAATIGLGKKRQDEKIPRLKITCHIPGSIHTIAGTKRTRVIVTSTPAPNAGKNCSTAMRIISFDKPE